MLIFLLFQGSQTLIIYYQIQPLTTMQNLINFFRHKNIFETYLTTHPQVSFQHIDKNFLSLLNSNQQQFVRFIDAKENALFPTLFKLTLVHKILIHKDCFLSTLEQLSLTGKCSDEWLNQHILVPYQNFLRRVILSSELYQRIRTINLGWNGECSPYNDYDCKQKMRENPQMYFNFEVMCYCINTLLELFSILKTVPNLGRYYHRGANTPVVGFVQMASFQCVLLYFPLKFVINQIITHPQKYIRNQREEEALKDILTVQLQKINQDLKALLLNKYFSLIVKGIRTTLFDLDRQTGETREYIQHITGIKMPVINKNTQSKKNRKFLQRKIFSQGTFDSHLFEQSIELVNTKTYRQDDLQQLYNKQNKQNSHKRSNTTSYCRIGKVLQQIGSEETMPSLSNIQ